MSAATVTLYHLLDTGALSEPVGTATTDPDGYYSILVECDCPGPAFVLAAGGTYVDEATGFVVQDDDLQLASLVMIEVGVEKTAHLTMATTMAARRAQLLAGEATIGAFDAMANAIVMVETYFGVTDILTTEPAPLTEGPVAPGAAAEHGALNAGCAQLADDLDVRLYSLIEVFANDGADGVLDGRLFGAPLKVDHVTGGLVDLPPEACGRGLIDALDYFLSHNPRDKSKLDLDALDVDEAIEDHIVDVPGEEEFSVFAALPRLNNVDITAAPVGTTPSVLLRFAATPSAAWEVFFGGIAATTVVADPLTLEVQPQAVGAAGRVDVEIRDPATGLYRMYSGLFEFYVPNRQPSIATIRPDHGPITGGTLVEVTGTEFDPAAIVEMGGIQCRTVARIGRETLVVVAPKGAGTVDVTLRQADQTGAADATRAQAFTYAEQDVGPGTDNGDLNGAWKFYTLGYGGDDNVFGGRYDVSFNGAGSYTQSGEWVNTSPTNTSGSIETLPAMTLPYALFQDGRVWLDPGQDMGAVRGLLADRRDVMVFEQEDTSDPVQTGFGVRRGQGMSTASLSGTWHIAMIGHEFDSGSDDRLGVSSFGTIEFDGAGSGSVGLIHAQWRGGTMPTERRVADGGRFTYAVNPDGTFSVTVAEDDGPRVIIQGSMTADADLAVGLFREEGRLALVMMLPAASRLTTPAQHGSWYGPEFSYEYDGPFGHYYGVDSVRVLQDNEGAQLIEYAYHGISNEDGPYFETDTYLAEVLVSPTGVITEYPEDVRGFVGASRRFKVVLPTLLETTPAATPIS
ncbi:MAG: IPT/TIG domain-containing protein, partial [Planctomycetota bacterium]|nr:IPT/TIG domain-containing protein [Planctomycetota bacterium]